MTFFLSWNSRLFHSMLKNDTRMKTILSTFYPYNRLQSHRASLQHRPLGFSTNTEVVSWNLHY